MYEGQFKNGINEGHGRDVYFDGSVYEGEFKNGQRHGAGKVAYADGDTYEGQFKNEAQTHKHQKKHSSTNLPHPLKVSFGVCVFGPRSLVCVVCLYMNDMASFTVLFMARPLSP